MDGRGRKTFRRILAASASVVVGCALCAGFSGIVLTSRPASCAQGPQKAGIIYSDTALETIARTAVTPRVYGSATQDSVSGRYRYAITLVNEPPSTNAIWKFVLDPVPRPITVTPPRNWMWAYGYDLRDKALAFGSEGDDTPHAADWDSVSEVRSVYDLQPGDSVTFRFVSDGAPSMVQYYVQGFYNDSLGTEDQGGLPPYSVFTNSITGTVIGPAIPLETADTLGRLEPPKRPVIQARAPNSSSAGATVAFFLPRPAKARLAVHDISGRLVQVLADHLYPAGFHSLMWDGSSSFGKKTPAGVYFFRLAVDGKRAGDQERVRVR